jgi:LuxR family glucitol operon transcriptional activator
MRNNRAKILEQLRQAREQGVLDEESYRAAIANLEADSGVQAEVEGSGAAAQEDGTAATTGSVSVRGDVGGSIAVNYHAAERTGTSLDHPEVRHNLPQPDYGRFVGRQEELAQVHRILRPYPHSRHPLVTIDGIGGIGKSALALEAAHHYLRDYDRLPEEEHFDAIIWTSAKSEVLTADGIAPRRQITRTLDDIYTAIAIALEREDITRARPEEQDELVTKALTRQRTLLIVDNLETANDERVSAFLRELPTPTKAIVTTRHCIDIGQSVHLASMSQKRALEFIAQECRKKKVTLKDVEARELYERTDGIPLVMVWSVAQIGYGYSVETVLQRLSETTGNIVRFCFEGAVKQIRDKEAHKLLVALSFFVTDASREALGHITVLPRMDRDKGLVKLERLSLLQRIRERFHVLPIVKRYTVATSHWSNSTVAEMRLRMVNYFLEFALNCCGNDYQGDLYERYPDLDVELPNILSVMEWCYFNKKWEYVLNLVHALTGGYYGSYLLSRGLWNIQVSWIDRATEAYYALSEGKRAENRWKIVMLLNSGCWTHILRGERDIAVRQAEIAVELARRSDDPKGLASALRQSGYVQQRIGNSEEAENRYQEALNIFTAIGDTQNAAGLMSVMGEFLLDQNDFENAERWFKRSIELLRSIEGQTKLAHALQRYGALLLEVDRLQEAQKRLEEGIDLAIAIQNLRIESECKLILARVLVKAGNVKKAKRILSEAYKGLTRMGMESAREAKTMLKSLQDEDTLCQN